MDLSNVLNIIGGAMGSNAQYKEQVASASGTMKEGLAIELDAKAKIAQLQGVQDIQKYQGDLQAQENARRVATMMGANIDADGEIISMLSARMKEAAIRSSDTAKKVAQMESQANIGNPFGLLYDAIYGDGDRAARDAAAAEFKTQTDLLNNLNQATTISAQTQMAIAQTKSDAGLLAEQDKVLANAEAIKGELMRSLAGVDINMINNLSSLDSTGVSMAAQAYNIQAMAEQRALARAEAVQNKEIRAAQLDQMKETRELTIIQKRMAIAQLQETEEGRANIVADIAAGIDVTGAPFAKPSTWAEANRIISADKARADRLASIGAQQRLGGVTSYGATPLEAISTQEALRANISEPARLVQGKLASVGAAATSNESLRAAGISMQDIPEVLKDKARVAQLQNEAMITKAKADAQVIRAGDRSNIYAMPNLDSFIEHKYMDVNPFLREKVMPMAAAGGAEFNPNILMSLGSESVLKGEASTKDVTDAITWLASVGMLTNNATVNYQKNFAVPNQTAVRMQVDIGGGMFSDRNRVVNLTDPTQVTKALVDKMSSDRVKMSGIAAQAGVNLPSFLDILSRDQGE